MASASRQAAAASCHASARTRTQTSALSITDASRASPSSDARRSTSSWRAVSTGASAGASSISAVGVSADDNRLTSLGGGSPSPALGHVLVADALLHQHGAFEQRLPSRRAARARHIHGDALGGALIHG